MMMLLAAVMPARYRFVPAEIVEQDMQPKEEDTFDSELDRGMGDDLAGARLPRQYSSEDEAPFSPLETRTDQAHPRLTDATRCA